MRHFVIHQQQKQNSITETAKKDSKYPHNKNNVTKQTDNITSDASYEL